MKKGRAKIYTDDDILDTLISFITNNNHHSIKSYNQSNLKPSISTIIKRFDTWSNALKEAQERMVKEESVEVDEAEYSDDYVFQKLIEALSENGGELTPSTYDNADYKPTSKFIMKRFKDWEQALQEAQKYHKNNIYYVEKQHKETISSIEPQSTNIEVDVINEVAMTVEEEPKQKIKKKPKWKGILKVISFGLIK